MFPYNHLAAAILLGTSLCVADADAGTVCSNAALWGCFGQCNADKVDCTNSETLWTDSLVKTFPSTITVLGLSNTGLPLLDEAYLILRDLTDLETLLLVENKIQKLTGRSLGNLGALTKLDLSKNEIVTIESTVFQAVTELKSLDLSHNKIALIQKGTFDQNTKLEELKLGNNKLLGLSGNIFEYQNALLTLILSFNDLDLCAGNAFAEDDRCLGATPRLNAAAFGGLTSLTNLELEKNLLVAITDELFSSLASLENLNLDQNSRLEEISDNAFKATTLLKKVSFKENEMVALKEGTIAALRNVNFVYLEGKRWDCCRTAWMNASVVDDISEAWCEQPESAYRLNWNAEKMNVDGAGLLNSECKAQEPEPPDTVTVPQSLMTSTSITVEWSTARGNAFKVDSYRLRYRKQDTESDGPWTIAQCPSGVYPKEHAMPGMLDCKIEPTAISETFSFEVTGLQKYTGYDIKVQSYSQLDGGTYSIDSSITTVKTLEDTPGEVASANTIASSAFGIDLMWLAPVTPNGIIVDYFIKCISNCAASEAAPRRVVPADAAKQQYTFPGLSPYQSYSFEIWAATSKGRGPAVTKTEKTLQAAPEAPTMPSLQAEKEGIKATQSTSIKIEWAPVTGAAANGIITGYTVYVNGKDTLNNGAVQGLGKIASSRYKTEVTGLTPSTDYYFQVSADTEDSAGKRMESTLSAGLEARTEQAAPEKMNVPIARGLSADEMIVTWEPPEVSNGPIKGYSVRIYPCVQELSEEFKKKCAELREKTKDDGYALRSDVNSTWPRTINTSSAALSTVEGNLKPATKYLLQVLSFNSLARSNYSEVGTGSTKESVPSDVTSSAVALSSTEINVSWTPPLNPNGFITGYTVYQVRATQQIKMYADWENDEVFAVGNTTASEPLTFRVITMPRCHDKTANDQKSGCIVPYTTYTFSVVAHSSAGSSALTHTCSAKTFEDIPFVMNAGPTVSDVGTKEATVKWSKPATPNGEITKFEIHGDQNAENASPLFSGLPEQDIDGKLMVVLANLKPDREYSFTVTAYTAKGASPKSQAFMASTNSQNANARVATLVTVLSIFVIILSLGFMWEHRLRRVAVDIEPLPLMTEPMPMVRNFGGGGIFPPAMMQGGMQTAPPGVNGGQASFEQAGGRLIGQPAPDPFVGLFADGSEQNRPGSPDSVSSASSASSASDSDS